MIASLGGIFEQPILLLQILVTILGAFLTVTIFNKLISRLEKGGELQKGKLVHLKRFFQIIIYLIAGIIVCARAKIE